MSIMISLRVLPMWQRHQGAVLTRLGEVGWDDGSGVAMRNEKTACPEMSATTQIWPALQKGRLGACHLCHRRAHASGTAMS